MRNCSLIALLIWFFTGNISQAQTQNTFTTKSISALPAEALNESSIHSFLKNGDSPDSSKATLRVRVLEKGVSNEPIQGATVLLQRDDDKMLGRVTLTDGRCQFSSSPAFYTVRVQMTGLKTLEKTGIHLKGGSVYDLDIRMVKN